MGLHYCASLDQCWRVVGIRAQLVQRTITQSGKRTACLTKYVNHLQLYKVFLFLRAFISEMKVFDLVLIRRHVREGCNQIIYLIYLASHYLLSQRVEGEKSFRPKIILIKLWILLSLPGMEENSLLVNLVLELLRGQCVSIGRRYSL